MFAAAKLGRDRRRRRDLKAVRRWGSCLRELALYAFYVAYLTSGPAARLAAPLVLKIGG